MLTIEARCWSRPFVAGTYDRAVPLCLRVVHPRCSSDARRSWRRTRRIAASRSRSRACRRSKQSVVCSCSFVTAPFRDPARRGVVSSCRGHRPSRRCGISETPPGPIRGGAGHLGRRDRGGYPASVIANPVHPQRHDHRSALQCGSSRSAGPRCTCSMRRAPPLGLDGALIGAVLHGRAVSRRSPGRLSCGRTDRADSASGPRWSARSFSSPLGRGAGARREGGPPIVAAGVSRGARGALVAFKRRGVQRHVVIALPSRGSRRVCSGDVERSGSSGSWPDPRVRDPRRLAWGDPSDCGNTLANLDRRSVRRVPVCPPFRRFARSASRRTCPPVE